MDTSTIIWIVIIVGAMIYNSVSKARKARQNGDNPPPQHGEAWPSIPWEEAPARSSADSPAPSRPRANVRPEQAAAKPVVRPEVRPVADATVRPQSGRRNSGELPKIEPTQPRSDDLHTPAAKGERQNGVLQPSQPVFGAFPDECQSLEEISPEAMMSEYIEPEAADFADLYDSEPDRERQQPSGASGQPARKGQNARGGSRPEVDTNPSSPSSQESVAKLVGEFDLRRAVIYSEILKPKFDED